MKTRLLSLFAAALCSLSAMAANYNLGNDLGSGWGSSWNAETKTITYDSAWSGRGWWFGGSDFSNYSDAVVKFKAVEFQVQLVCQYKDAAGTEINETSMAEPGATSVSIALNDTYSKNTVQIYLQAAAVGSLTLDEAYLVEKPAAGSVKDIPFDAQYGHVLLSDYSSYADTDVVKLTLTVTSGEGVTTEVGWGIGAIRPIGNYDVSSKDLSCTAISAEGADNVYTMTIADLKEYAKVGGVYYTDSYDRQGITINLWGGAALKSLVVYDSTVTGVENTKADVVSVEYFSITGMRIASPVKGINLVRKTMSDGKVSTKKIYVNE